MFAHVLFDYIGPHIIGQRLQELKVDAGIRNVHILAVHGDYCTSECRRGWLCGTVRWYRIARVSLRRKAGPRLR